MRCKVIHLLEAMLPETAIPQPDQLLNAAEKESVKFNVEDYWQTILVLRQKNYSWRDISAWFRREGLPTDHTRLYRFGQKCAALRIATMQEDERPFAAADMLADTIQELVEFGNLPELIREIRLSDAGVDEYEVPAVEVIPAEGIVISIRFHVTSAHASGEDYRGAKIRGTATGILRPDNSVEYGNIVAEVEEAQKPKVLGRWLSN